MKLSRRAGQRAYVRMLCGPHVGRIGYIVREIEKAAVEAYEVRLPEIELHIVTVPSHYTQEDETAPAA